MPNWFPWTLKLAVWEVFHAAQWHGLGIYTVHLCTLAWAAPLSEMLPTTHLVRPNQMLLSFRFLTLCWPSSYLSLFLLLAFMHASHDMSHRLSFIHVYKHIHIHDVPHVYICRDHVLFIISLQHSAAAQLVFYMKMKWLKCLIVCVL
jgi:hypothetical protein